MVFVIMVMPLSRSICSSRHALRATAAWGEAMSSAIWVRADRSRYSRDRLRHRPREESWRPPPALDRGRSALLRLKAAAHQLLASAGGHVDPGILLAVAPGGAGARRVRGSRSSPPWRRRSTSR